MQLEILSKIRDLHKNYVEVVHRFRDPDFDAAFRKMLAEPGNLSKGPYVEVLPSYELSDETRSVFSEFVGAEIEDEFLRAIGAFDRLYWHQAEAMRQVANGQNVLVASGTGSGKTESFLYPIIAALYKEMLTGDMRLEGVRAMIIYPMNALGNDQLDRLGTIAEALKAEGSSFRFTYGQYTGETPQNVKDSARGGPARARSARNGEIVFRDDMQDSPPNILLTNYSMLEYMLLRPEDSPLFDGGSAENWKFIVLDEAHQYNGTKGTEIGLLLRRLKQRIREGGRSAPFTCIATSATMVHSDADLPDAARFAASIFDENFSNANILRGRKTGLPPKDSLEAIARSSGPVAESAKFLIDPSNNRMLQALWERPRTIQELQAEFGLDGLEVSRIVEQISGLSNPITGLPLTTVRFHQFLRTIPGLYTAYFPEKMVAMNPNEMGSSWFNTSLCTRCGQHYLEGQILGGRLLEATERLYEPTDATRSFFLPTDESDSSGILWWLNIQSSEIMPATSKGWAEWPHRIPLLAVEVSARSVTGELSSCHLCGNSGREPIRSPRLEVLEPQSLLTLGINRYMPPGGERVLAFADGRQDAARFARDAQQFGDKVLMRGLLLEILRSAEESGTTTHSIKDLASRLFAPLSRLRAVDFQGQQGHEKALRFLLEEILDPGDIGSLSGMGICTAELEIGTDIPSIIAKPEIPLNVEFEIIQRILATGFDDLTLFIGGFDQIVPLRSLEGRKMFEKSWVLGAPKTRRNVVSFDSAKSRRGVILKEAAEELGLELSIAEIEETLRDIYAWMKEFVDEYRTPLLQTDNYGEQIDATLIRVRYHPNLSRWCPSCKRPMAKGQLKRCPKPRCRGILEETSAARLVGNPFLELYGQKFDRRFVIQEHTAQLTSQQGRRYQDEFRENRVQALSSSTTFELGVDLGSLNVVFLRNIPPEPFNYTQRVGRVGRRKGNPGIAIVYARQRSHDFYHFGDPTKMILGAVRPPRISLENERIFSRHVVACVISKFFRTYPSTIDNLSSFMEYGESGIVDAIVEFSTTKKAEIETHLLNCFGHISTHENSIKNGEWLAWLVASESSLQKASHAYDSELRELKDLEDNSAKKRDHHLAGWAKRRADTIRQSYTLSELSRHSVIPKYGFPVDVVSLDTQPDRKSGKEATVDLQRDLAVAIREYAPGSIVIANQQFFESVAIKTLPHVELDKKWFRACSVHGIYTQTLNQSQLPKNQCCKKMLVGQYVVPRLGFMTRPKSSETSSGHSRYLTATEPFFVEHAGTALELSLVSNSIKVVAAGQATMVIVGSGARRKPFKICESCGLSLSTSKETITDAGHAPPRFPNASFRVCKSHGVDLFLAHTFTTTVLKVEFPKLATIKDDSERAIFFNGLGTAIAESASELLQVPSAEIGYTLTAEGELGSKLLLVLFDQAPGGAGLVEQLRDSRLLYETLFRAKERVDGSCGCAENASCYQCLRTYSNQAFHPFLQRGKVHYALGKLVSQFNVEDAAFLTGAQA